MPSGRTWPSTMASASGRSWRLTEAFADNAPGRLSAGARRRQEKSESPAETRPLLR